MQFYKIDNLNFVVKTIYLDKAIYHMTYELNSSFFPVFLNTAVSMTALWVEHTRLGILERGEEGGREGGRREIMHDARWSILEICSFL